MNEQLARPPLAALVPPDDGRNLLQEIPVEILTRILTFGDVASLVLLAATNSHHRHFVFKDCPTIWREISFEGIPQAERLSDTALHRLLNNIDARNVTSSFSLLGCANVRGYALSAFMFSEKLEIVELRKSREDFDTFGETGLDDAFVVSVLSSMAPINREVNGRGLKVVKIRRQFDNMPTFYEGYSVQLSGFLYELNHSIARYMREKRVACSLCHETLTERIPNEDFEWKAPTCFCTECKKYKCGEASCKDVYDCHICMRYICEDCCFCTSCALCGNFFCDECRIIGSCETCHDNYCEECRKTSICDGCGKGWCVDCKRVVTCALCEEEFCEDCRETKQCNVCDDYFCTECDALEQCPSCKKIHCQTCRDCCCHDEPKSKSHSSDENQSSDDSDESLDNDDDAKPPSAKRARTQGTYSSLVGRVL